jgi:hypothetical protein
MLGFMDSDRLERWSIGRYRDAGTDKALRAAPRQGQRDSNLAARCANKLKYGARGTYETRTFLGYATARILGTC